MKKRQQGGLVTTIGSSLLVVMFFFLFSTPRYLGPIWDSTLHGILFEKKYKTLFSSSKLFQPKK
jgi:hypothetical protein